VVFRAMYRVYTESTSEVSEHRDEDRTDANEIHGEHEDEPERDQHEEDQHEETEGAAMSCPGQKRRPRHYKIGRKSDGCPAGFLAEMGKNNSHSMFSAEISNLDARSHPADIWLMSAADLSQTSTSSDVELLSIGPRGVGLPALPHLPPFSRSPSLSLLPPRSPSRCLFI